MDTNPSAHRALLEAVSFAARAHHGQLRKDRQTPYASHPFRVCLVARHVFGVEDPTVLTAAVLHDTVEDTTTDYDDLLKHFGAEVAGWVALLSKDKRLPEGPREEAYRAGLKAAPWQVKVCKLADVYDNLLDGRHLSSEHRGRTLERSRSYLAVLDDPHLPEPARRAFDTVRDLLKEIAERAVSAPGEPAASAAGSGETTAKRNRY
jgi:guanosine-3',5'-bis(diphosphate) 3'-pyrophosphohydrolase